MAATDAIRFSLCTQAARWGMFAVLAFMGVMVFFADKSYRGGVEASDPIWQRSVGGALMGLSVVVLLYRHEVVVDRGGGRVHILRGLVIPFRVASHLLTRFSHLAIRREVKTRMTRRRFGRHALLLPRRDGQLTLDLVSPDVRVTLIDLSEDVHRAETGLRYALIRDRAKAVGGYLDLPVVHEAGAGAASAQYNPEKLNASMASWNASRKGRPPDGVGRRDPRDA